MVSKSPARPIKRIETQTDETSIVVGLGEIWVTRNPNAVLVTFGLGSCVALCVYDLDAKVAGMMHVVLPSANNATANSKCPGKYADGGTPLLIQRMENLGAVRSRMVAKIAGGAKVVRGAASETLLDIGQKNIEAVKTALQRQNIAISAFDTGGAHGRSVWLRAKTGVMMVRTASNGYIQF